MWTFSMWPFGTPQASEVSSLSSWVTLGLDFTQDKFRALMQSDRDGSFYSSIEELLPYLLVFLLGFGILYLCKIYHRKQHAKQLLRVEMRDIAMILVRQVQQTVALQQMLLVRLERVEALLPTLEEEKRSLQEDSCLQEASCLQEEAAGSCCPQASEVSKPI
ncbi:uncharacterized protein LOC143493579 [Brachyhypopomus gauderio]|uniref:uncharacterized protein LOC143493579 n=1 Tax=Brachyhypopomus gauderio TaxID=698409 RepID=UPI0040437C94